MPQTSFAVMTTLGRAKEAAALANATKITITQIAIGDGATVPSGGETALYHEVARKTISGHGTVVGAANVAYFDCYLAAGDGPYTIKEAGLYDDVGDLIAIAHYDPPINKPVPASGQTVEGTVRLEVAFSDVANVTIVVDPSMQVALQRLTRLPWIPIISMSLTTPPASPVVGDTYLIATPATGAWTAQEGKIAEYTIAGWAIITPPNGHGVSLPDGRVFERVTGTYIEKLALDAQSGKWRYGVAGGTASALTLTLAPAPAAYADGMALHFRATADCAGATTLNVNGLGTVPITRMGGAFLSRWDFIANDKLAVIYQGGSFQLLTVARGEFQRPLPSGGLILYVRTDGNDNNDGSANTAAAAFKTINAAANYAIRRYSVGSGSTTIQLGIPGSYAAAAIFGIPNLVIRGDPANKSAYRVGDAVALNGLSLTGCPNAAVQGLTTVDGITASTSSNSILIGQGTSALLIDVGLDATAYHAGGALLTINGGGSCQIAGEIALLRSAVKAIAVLPGGLFLGAAFSAPAVINLGVGGFSWDIFCQCQSGNASFLATSFTTSASTGKRYEVSMNGTINTGGAGASFLPGTVAGTAPTGGQYA